MRPAEHGAAGFDPLLAQQLVEQRRRGEARIVRKMVLAEAAVDD